MTPTMPEPEPSRQTAVARHSAAGFSIGVLALRALGAASLVLAVTTLLIAVVPYGARLPIAFGGILAAVGALGVVATRYVNRTLGSHPRPGHGPIPGR